MWPRWSQTPLRRGCCLLLLFLLSKIIIVALRLSDGGRGLLSPWLPVILLPQDLIVALVLGAADLLLSWLAGPRCWLQRLLWGIYGAIAIYLAINIPVARVFGSPLTAAMLAATGGALADSLAAYVTPGNLLGAAVVLGGAVLAPRLLRRPPGPRAALCSALIALVVIGLSPRARGKVETFGLQQNALWALLRTTAARRAGDARQAGPPPPLAALPELPQGTAALDLAGLRGAAAGRHVLWIVLESTAAQYLRPYGAAGIDPMPGLSALAAQGLVFESLYAAYPESIKGLYSQLCAIDPALHTKADRYTQARLPCASLAQALRHAGYRTAMFHSGWFLYLGMQGVVDDRGFEVLRDAGGIGGRYATSFGVDEDSTVDALLRHIDGLRPAERWFTMYLPIAGHHPYVAPGPQERPRPFGRGSELQRYQNDLRFGDLALQRLIRELQRRGLYEQTLFVISGDHGEAFQQHEGNFAHTLFLYEENLRVPLVVLAPGKIAPGRAPRLGSVIDIAPTLLDLLGLPVMAGAQGRSLLPVAPRVARFFSDQTVLRIGLRQGDYKFIHAIDEGRSQLFDLQQDPGETRDLSAQMPALVERYRDHLLAWAARQRAWVAGGSAE